MARDQAKMNQIMNNETSNLKYQRERERERGLTCVALAENTINHIKDY